MTPIDPDERLRELLTDAVSDVEPGHRLTEIRARTARPDRRARWYVAGGTVLATAAAVLAAALINQPSRAPGPSKPPASTATDPATSAPEGTRVVPVYFVGDTPAGPRLFREFRRVTGRDHSKSMALLMGGPEDPDYRSLWPDGSLASSVGFDGIGSQGFFAVRLQDPGLADRFPGLTELEAQLAVQQVVYTLQGAAGTAARVAFYDGSRQVPVLGIDYEQGVDRLPQNDVLAPVSISDPEEGLAVSGSFTARGRANSFEATVPWEVRDENDATVLQGFATAEGTMDKLYPWETEVDVSGLAPGTYTFVAMTSDPSGGAEGPGATSDTRTILVE